MLLAEIDLGASDGDAEQEAGFLEEPLLVATFPIVQLAAELGTPVVGSIVLDGYVQSEDLRMSSGHWGFFTGSP